VERAHRGEDILITVRGRVKARLTRATSAEDAPDPKAWTDELRKLQAEYFTGKSALTSDEILLQDRGQ
jgi:antitoxin (DNA-binding transcriptional repressor) of toxin-antitoxin stability system